MNVAELYEESVRLLMFVHRIDMLDRLTWIG